MIIFQVFCLETGRNAGAEVLEVFCLETGLGAWTHPSHPNLCDLYINLTNLRKFILQPTQLNSNHVYLKNTWGSYLISISEAPLSVNSWICHCAGGTKAEN